MSDRFLSNKDYVRELVLSNINQLNDNIRVVSLNGVAGNLTALTKSINISNVRFKVGGGSIAVPVFPVSLTTETELTIYFDIASFDNNNGFIKITGRDN